MISIPDSLKEVIYSEKNIEAYIWSFLLNTNDYLSLIIYQKNYESENYRVDYIDLINLDSKGNLLDKINLSIKYDEVITYETISYLKDDTLKIIEKLSSEYNDGDTLYTTECLINLNPSIGRLDTIEINTNFKLRN